MLSRFSLYAEALRGQHLGMASPMELLHGFASWLERATARGDWRTIPDDNMLRLKRRRKAAFPDKDAMRAMIEALANRSGAAVSFSAANGTTIHSDPVAGTASIAALPSSQDRAVVTFSGFRYDGEWANVDPLVRAHPSWTLTVSILNGAEFTVIDFGRGARSFADSVVAEVDRFVVNASRRKTVIEPLSLEEASQRAHERELASKSARVGGWWGALGGAAVGGVVTFIVNLVTAIPG